MGKKSKEKTTKCQCEELFKRYKHNPILTSKDWPYTVNAVFNPAATEYKGKTLILARVEDKKGFSHLTKAISDNGLDNWKIDRKPTMNPDPENYPEDIEGIEDPRIIWIEEIKKYAILYTSCSKGGPLVSLALTGDFKKIERIGAIMPPEDKDAALFPRKINGKWILVHRPLPGHEGPGGHIWLSCSKDLKYWGEHKLIMQARKGTWWDANKIGLNTPPLETSEGWLILYHGVRYTMSGAIYRLGLALLDLNNPFKVLRRSDEWVFSPEAHYEREGDVDNVVFPGGWIHDKKTDEVRLYYGAADTSIALATAKLNDLIQYIKKCPEPKN